MQSYIGTANHQSFALDVRDQSVCRSHEHLTDPASQLGRSLVVWDFETVGQLLSSLSPDDPLFD
jgi:hypothetical protein